MPSLPRLDGLSLGLCLKSGGRDTSRRADHQNSREVSQSVMVRSEAVDEATELRELAGWYREFAEQSGNPTIWDSRLRTAEDLEAEATQLESCSGCATPDA